MIKANDVLGFSYKLEEYFSPGVLNLEFLTPLSLELSLLICVVEVTVGFAALIGSRIKLTSWILLLMILFFTWLTFYSAYYGVVKDCGCFGEAIKLTPWESFTKDVALLVLVLIIFASRNKVRYNSASEDLAIFLPSLVLIGAFSYGLLGWGFPLIFTLILVGFSVVVKTILGYRTPRSEWIPALATGIFVLGFSLYCLYYLPVKDFRPYAVGKNIPEQMTVPEGEGPVYESTFIYKNKSTGKERTFSEDNYPLVNDELDDDNWEYVDRSTRLVKEGKTPAIHDFVMTDDQGNNVTHKLIGDTATGEATGPVFVLVAYDITASAEAPQQKVNTLAQKAEKSGIPFYGLSASSNEEVDTFRHEHQNMFPYFTADATLLKTIIRSNPGLLLLKNGTVMGKWPHTALPEYQKVQKEYLNNS